MLSDWLTVLYARVQSRFHVFFVICKRSVGYLPFNFCCIERSDRLGPGVRQRTTDEAMQIFYKEFQIAYNKTFLFVKLSRKRADDKPWISTALKNCIKQKHKLYQKFLLDQTPHNEMLYKAYKNRLKALIRKSEINYYQNIFSNRKNNIKDMWKHLGFLLNPNKNNSQNKNQ